jgi:hypothetical protein
MGIHKVTAMCVALVVLAMCDIAAGAEIAGDRGASEAQFVTSCFPDHIWSEPGATAPWQARPCDVLLRPQEDGSTRVLQQTAAYELAECVLPNPREERGRFVARCHRTPRLRAEAASHEPALIDPAAQGPYTQPPQKERACGAAEAEYEELLAEIEAEEAEETE